MGAVEKQTIVKLIASCKSELLNHTLQNEVVSPHIKKINSYFDECLAVLTSDWEKVTRIRGARRPRLAGDARDNILFFAYCMSKWDYPFVNSITGRIFNQSEAFNYLANKLEVKENTLRNYRDTFDSHIQQIRSNRQGWKKKLNPKFLQVKEKYDSFTEEKLSDIAKNIFQNL